MRTLELKIPPPLLALVLILAMWGLAQFPPHWEYDPLILYLLVFSLLTIGVAFAVSGFASFYLAKTTISPIRPEKASALVTTGIYRITRNPMYVGLLFLLTAWACFLSSLWPILGILIFFVWINYLQIIPEERALAKLFGEEYTRYRSQVRRWL